MGMRLKNAAVETKNLLLSLPVHNLLPRGCINTLGNVTYIPFDSRVQHYHGHHHEIAITSNGWNHQILFVYSSVSFRFAHLSPPSPDSMLTDLFAQGQPSLFVLLRKNTCLKPVLGRLYEGDRRERVVRDGANMLGADQGSGI